MDSSKAAFADFVDSFTNDLRICLDRSEPGSPRAFALSRQLARLRKKLGSRSNQQLITKAREKFLLINDEMQKFSHSLTSLEIGEASDFISHCLWQHTSALYENAAPQSAVTVDVFLDLWRFGPGGSLGTDSTHTADKISEDWTATARAFPYVDLIRRSQPYIRGRDAQKGVTGITLVNGNKLGFAPKNEESVRTIATEPCGNMAAQLALGEHVAGALSRIGLDIPTQQAKNRRLAWRGSLHGNLATLDLSSASDRIHPSVVQALFPSDIFRVFSDLRADVADVDGELVPLHMLSTMGNGFTFAVMTLLLLGLVYANRRLNGRCKRNWVDWNITAVNGDDIIVPVEEYESLVDLLQRAGFSVNLEKSYSSGPFRESCGGDYYNGFDVTPVYMKDPHTIMDKYVCANQVMAFISKHRVWPYHTGPSMKRLLGGHVFLVPEWLDPSYGLLSSQVAHTYTYFRKKTKPSILKNDQWLASLAAGGYVSSDTRGRGLYITREASWEIERRKGVLPRGYTSGMDPGYRTVSEREFSELVTQIFLV